MLGLPEKIMSVPILGYCECPGWVRVRTDFVVKFLAIGTDYIAEESEANREQSRELLQNFLPISAALLT